MALCFFSSRNLNVSNVFPQHAFLILFNMALSFFLPLSTFLITDEGIFIYSYNVSFLILFFLPICRHILK